MALRADSDGFLISDRRVDLSMDRERLKLLRAIKADTARMAALLEGSTHNSGYGPASSRRTAAMSPVAAAIAQRQAANAPVAGAARGRREQAQPSGEASPATVQRRQREQKVQERAEGRARDRESRFAPASQQGVDEVRKKKAADKKDADQKKEKKRDKSGRFKSSDERKADAEGAEQSSHPEGERGSSMMAKLGSLTSKIGDGISSLLNGNENLDPSIAAAKEVSESLAPVTKPFVAAGRWLFGKKDDATSAEKKVAVPWYRRIFGELKGINQKSGGRSGGGSFFGKALGGIGSVLGKIPGVGMLGKVLGGVGRIAMGGLKRLPLIGNLISSAMSLSTLFDSSASREDKFHAGGSGVGTLIGGAVGSLLGPLGTMVGGMIGDKLGGMVGDWLSTVNWDEVGKTITGAWDATTKTISSGWEWCKNKFGGVFDSIGSSFADAGKWIADKFKPIAEFADKAKQKVVEVAGKAKDYAVEKTAPAVNAVKDFADTAAVKGERFLGTLDKGYRHRETFDGITGGATMARMGSYTNDEADKIRELKSSGANTSGRVKGGMPLDMRNEIIGQAKGAGLNPQDMLDIAGIESGGNANAISSTGAIGVYQMTGKTATGLGISDRFDMKQNIAGGMALALQDAAMLKSAGLPVNRDNLYMLHQLGPTAGLEVIKGAATGKSTSQLSEKTQASMNLNVGKGSKSASDYLATNSIALDAKLGKVSATMPPLLAAKSAVPTSAGSAPSVASVVMATDKNAASSPAPVPLKVASNDTQAPAPVIIESPLTQNLADRGLAHAATGGIGLGLGGGR